jgi:hypothetical protein
MTSKHRLAVAIVAVVAILGVGLRAWAAMNVPAGFSYSGLLKNGGTAESGVHTHNFNFELFDGNATVCTDTRATLTVTDGRFDVQNLFSGCGTLDAALATRPSLSIRITVDGTLLSPPQPIGTVPYAARARVAESAEAVPASVTASLVKGWVSFNGTAGACTPNCPLNDSFNVASVTRVNAGEYLITWTTPFTTATYVVTGACQRTDADASLMFQIGRGLTTNPLTTGTARVGCGNYNGVALDSGLLNVTAFGR